VQFDPVYSASGLVVRPVVEGDPGHGDRNAQGTISVELDFIRPGKPIENALIESFNGRLRDECLNVQEFTSLADAALRIEIWRQDYNRNRPHGALGNLAPSEYAARGQEEASEGAEFQFGSVQIRG
jgi:transposase InsO family protein